jgi:HNH endonuclease
VKELDERETQSRDPASRSSGPDSRSIPPGGGFPVEEAPGDGSQRTGSPPPEKFPNFPLGAPHSSGSFQWGKRGANVARHRMICRMPICVYCLGEKPRSKFTREHAFPAAFGTFANNLMKLRCVCQPCNQLFGDSIELAFGRDSFEAYLRFRYQVKRTAEGRRVGLYPRCLFLRRPGRVARSIASACAGRFWSSGRSRTAGRVQEQGFGRVEALF